MSEFKTATLPELIARAQGDLAGADNFRRSDAQVLARVHAGACFGLYGYLDYISDQILPDRCSAEMLMRHGRFRSIRERLPGVAASGFVEFSGQSGAVLDAGTFLRRTDGARFYVVEAVTLSSGTGLALVRAEDEGMLGNTDGGVELRLVSPVRGIVDLFPVVAPGLRGGVEVETVAAFRERVIRSYRLIPHGGNKDDYETWALEVPGVTRAWVVRRWIGPGTVAVFVMRDGDPDPLPGEQERAAVAEYIEAQRPVTAELYVLSPEPKPILYEIHLSPDTTATRAVVEQSLRDLHYREAGLGDGLLWTHMGEAISTAQGENDHTLISPVADVAANANEILTFGGVTWR